jgi:nitrogen fixation/metabolism regulation signal transduction histidine kinase
MQITIEYMILIPILIVQMFLFPIAVSGIMNHWADQRMELALDEAAGHVGSSIAQTYFSLNRTYIQECTIQSAVDVKPLIEGYTYIGNASLRTILDPELSTMKMLEITFKLVGSSISTTTEVTLGQNVEWTPSVFNSTAACLYATKSNDVIWLSFES